MVTNIHFHSFGGIKKILNLKIRVLEQLLDMLKAFVEPFDAAGLVNVRDNHT